MTSENNSALDMLDTLLDRNLDDLADLPEFKTPDTGIYKLTVWAEPKVINDKGAVIAKCTIVELVELADSTIPEEQRSKPGDKFDVAFMLQDNSGEKNDLGEGRLKDFVKPFAAHFGTQNVRAIVAGMNEANAVAITAQVQKVQRKSDKEKFDARIKDITID